MAARPKFNVRTRDQVVTDMTPTRRIRPHNAAKSAALSFPGEARAAEYHETLAALVLDETAFPKLRVPGPSDWLACRHEAGQSFSSYAAQSSFNVATPHGNFDTLLVVVFGEESFSPQVLALLQDYVRAFYSPLRVEFVVQSIDFDTAGRVKRGAKGAPAAEVRRCTGSHGVGFVEQVVAADLMALATKAKSSNLPLCRRVIATMGLTGYDLGLDEEGFEWVYGVARAAESCGVFSMARFHPSFCGGDGISIDADAIILRRACKVLTHELGHLFGLRHCINLQCLMNGVNHVGELNQQPLLECPACTKKLTLCIGWNLEERYAALARVTARLNFDDASATIAHHLLPRFATIPIAAAAAPLDAECNGNPGVQIKQRSTPPPPLSRPTAVVCRSKSLKREGRLQGSRPSADPRPRALSAERANM